MRIKGLAVSLAAALTLGTMAVVANASEYNNSFYFDLAWHGGTEFSPAATKNNDRNYAQVNAKTGYVSEESFAYISVYSDNTGVGDNCVSDSYKVVDLRREFSLNYTEPRGIGSTNYLCGLAGYMVLR